MKKHGAVAAGHDVTARAAADVLEAGGNAFDAVTAAMWTACVAEPVLASLGGGGFVMTRPAGKPPRLYDFFVEAIIFDLIQINPVESSHTTVTLNAHFKDRSTNIRKKRRFQYF